MPGATDSLAEANRLEPDRPLTLLALGLVSQQPQALRGGEDRARRAASSCSRTASRRLAALAEAEAGLGDSDAAERATRSARSPRSAGNATANLVLGPGAEAAASYPEARDACSRPLAADPDAAESALPAEPRLRAARRRRERQRSTSRSIRRSCADVEDATRRSALAGVACGIGSEPSCAGRAARVVIARGCRVARRPRSAARQPRSLFRDVTREAGITFQHHAAPEKKYIVESMSGGVALFDYDNDGRLDIYFVDSLTVDTAERPEGGAQRALPQPRAAASSRT